MSSSAQSLRVARWLPAGFRVLIVAMGAVHTWAAVRSQSMNADGINYLDMGEAYLRGDWQTAINTVWSPMYAWLLGIVLKVVQPAMAWEFPTVQIVNFVVFVGVLACFEFFWRQVMRYHALRIASDADPAAQPLPGWAMQSLGYLLFVYAALVFIEIWSVTPDMFLAGFVLLAAGLLVRSRTEEPSRRDALLLGGLLGLGYLTKTALLPLAFVFLGVRLFSGDTVRRAVPYVLAALAVFLVVITPYITMLSASKGRFAYGSAGTLTYLRHVNGIPYPYWQGESPGYGTPAHPARVLFDEPPVYEFATPIGGTYPVSYDPSYWYEGAVARVDAAQQGRRLFSSLVFYLDLFLREIGGLTFGMLVLYGLRRRRFTGMAPFIRSWGLALIALAAMGLYALVLVEGRYVGVFVVLLGADLLANVRPPDGRRGRRVARAVAGAMAIVLLGNLLLFNLRGYGDLTNRSAAAGATHAAPPRWPGEVAEALQAAGLAPGDPVAVIGYAFDSYWARLARVKIVAEMPGGEADPFWLGEETFQRRVLDAFAESGARAVVAEHVPPYAALMPGWRQVGASYCYIRVLDQPETP